jgi:hypothetical protein
MSGCGDGIFIRSITDTAAAYDGVVTPALPFGTLPVIVERLQGFHAIPRFFEVFFETTISVVL